MTTSRGGSHASSFMIRQVVKPLVILQMHTSESCHGVHDKAHLPEINLILYGNNVPNTRQDAILIEIRS